MASIPSLLAILMCDQVIIDAATSKKTLVGLFDHIGASQFPAMQPVGFYARLTDLEGEYTFVIRVVNLTDGEKRVGELRTPPIKQPDRLAFLELALNLPPVPFPQPGQYEFQLYANEDYIGRSVIKVGPPPKLKGGN